LSDLKTFKLNWRTGKPQFVTGTDIADACNRAGIGAGALPALDYWENVPDVTDLIKVVETEHAVGPTGANLD